MKHAPVLVVLARMSAGHAAGAADTTKASAITPTNNAAFIAVKNFVFIEGLGQGEKILIEQTS